MHRKRLLTKSWRFSSPRGTHGLSAVLQHSQPRLNSHSNKELHTQVFTANQPHRLGHRSQCRHVRFALDSFRPSLGAYISSGIINLQPCNKRTNRSLGHRHASCCNQKPEQPSRYKSSTIQYGSLVSSCGLRLSPVPGGPVNMSPLGSFPPSLVNTWGFLRYMTISSSSDFA